MTRRQTVRVDGFSDPEAFREYFKAHYGPTVVAYQGIVDDSERTAALDRDLAELAQRHDRGAAGALAMDWEYLLFTARKH
jgi:hypothetical protein